MAKKTYRYNKRSGSSSAGGSKAEVRTADFNPDYAYVKKDLRQIGILAGSFFAILIVLSFIL
jgi:hypothetical protein